MNENWIPWGISAISLLFVILTFARTGKKDFKKEVLEDNSKIDGIKESLLKVNMKLDQVCAVTNETRTDIKALNKDIQGLDKRVCVAERDMKTVFNLIDEIKKGEKQ